MTRVTGVTQDDWDDHENWDDYGDQGDLGWLELLRMTGLTWMTWIRMTGLSQVTGMTRMARVFSILPAFKKGVCSKLGETGRPFLSYCKIQITICVENVNKIAQNRLKLCMEKKALSDFPCTALFSRFVS